MMGGGEDRGCWMLLLRSALKVLGHRETFMSVQMLVLSLENGTDLIGGLKSSSRRRNRLEPGRPVFKQR